MKQKATICLEATKEEYHCDLECLSWDSEGNEVFDFNECGNIDCKILLISVDDAVSVAEEWFKQKLQEIYHIIAEHLNSEEEACSLISEIEKCFVEKKIKIDSLEIMERMEDEECLRGTSYEKPKECFVEKKKEKKNNE